MPKKRVMIFKDTDTIKNIIVQMDLKSNQAILISNFDPWENIALLLEAVGMQAEVCLKKGMSKEEVYKGITDYLMKTLTSYTIITSSENFN